jgi:glycosyltransferase involved in cell wall biosynthesis
VKVAIVYDRVNKWGGAERVLLALHELFPDAPLYTSVYSKKNAGWAKVFPEIRTSFLQKIPMARSNHEFLAPLMPFAFKSFDLSGYNVVISVTSEFAKSIKTGTNTLHICYCLTPTRYLWSGYEHYFKNDIFRRLSKPLVSFLRKQDIKASKNPDIFIAISTEVRERIKKYYKRSSLIVFPPVDIKRNKKAAKRKHYLLVSRLDYGYKKVDLAIKAFNKLRLPLIIVGTGREENKLKEMAGKNIRFAGKVSEKRLSDLYSSARALVMPQEEDFGIVAVEAQSHAVPVIAYKKGGVLDTVINQKTGIYFENQNEASLIEAISRFEKMNFIADNLFTNARKFAKENFKRNFAKIVHNERKKRKL